MSGGLSEMLRASREEVGQLRQEIQQLESLVADALREKSNAEAENKRLRGQLAAIERRGFDL